MSEKKTAWIVLLRNGKVSVAELEVVVITPRRVEMKNRNRWESDFQTYVTYEGTDLRAFVGVGAGYRAATWAAEQLEANAERLVADVIRNRGRAADLREFASSISREINPVSRVFTRLEPTHRSRG